MDNQSDMVEHCSYCERQKLLDMLNEALLLIDACNYTVTFMNKKARVMYGYPNEEVKRLHVTDIDCNSAEAIIYGLELVKVDVNSSRIFTSSHRHKNGRIFKVQVSVNFIKFHGSETFVAIIRDMNPYLRLKEDVVKAERIQRKFLPPDIDNEWTLMKSIYQPHGHISGDLYGYKWYKDDPILFGYIIDVMGHGIATALQTATLRVLFQQVSEMNIPLNEKLAWLNRNAAPYFVEDSFAAAICFELDFSKQRLSCSASGINHFIISNSGKKKIVTIPGPFLGISEKVSFDTYEQNVKSGDYIFFFSDGLSGQIPDSSGSVAANFESEYWKLARLSASGVCVDDATAMCFYIK